MDLKATLLTVATGYCSATGMSKARLATLIANDGKFFARIEGGGGFTIQTFERAMQWISDHWPEGAEWPPNFIRPRPTPNPASGPAEAA
jgi:hypothetical protein